jgi:chromosome partitioning protein
VAQEVRRYFGEKVFETIVQRNVRVSEAPSFGKPVLLYDATSTGAKNYMALAREILESNMEFLQSHNGEVQEEASSSGDPDSLPDLPDHPSQSSTTPANGFSL